jgi:agmatinase
VAPPYDHADVTAIAGATVAMHYLGLLAVRRQTATSRKPD